VTARGKASRAPRAAGANGNMSNPTRTTHGVRVVALMEAAKAAIVLVAGFGLLSAIHKGAAQVADDLARHMHLNPAQGFPHIFVDLAGKTSSSQLWLLAAGAFGYAAMRATEAFGLWHRRRWAEWFAVASGGLYVPVEFYEIARGFSGIKLVMLLANLGIVAYMAYALRVSGRPPVP
jgi:uncharacterized membrane protein (DUF2068 family)